MKTTPTDLVPKLNATLSATWSAALFAMLSTALLALPVQPVAAAPPAAVAANAKVARLYEDALVRYEKQDLAGAISLDAAMAAALIATRQYQKRQQTWARNQFADWARTAPD